MAGRLTESKLRQIIREEAAKLSRRPTRRLREFADAPMMRLAADIQQALNMVDAAPRDLNTLSSYVAQGDEEAIIFMLKRIFKPMKRDPLVVGVMARLEEMADEDPSELYETLDQVESLRMGSRF